jgi:acyl transferase domain-containing protein
VSDFLDRITKLSPKRLALLALELQTKLEALEGAGPEPIAIIGLGCRLPGGADSPAELWRLLQRSGDGIVEVPADRWDVDAIFDPDPDAPGKISTRFGGFLRDVTRFDAEFFGITPREAASMDPQQRLMLEVAWEALEDAGQAPDSLAGSATGVFVGVCNADYFQRIVRRDATALDAYVATGGAHSVAAGRLAYLLGLQGPNLAVDTACSSSLVAVHLACQSLRNRECRMALAGGVNVIVTPEVTMMLSRARMMAPDGRCKVFDARADGFVRGEGAGLIVLKRLSDAQADGDEVLAVIRGTAINQDGRSNGLTAPNGPAQEAVVRTALADARVAAHEIAYVEAHGTGTSLGDPIELRALGAALGAGRTPDRPVLVGSLKANVGHLESAAGIAGLIKVVLAMRHGEIPRQLHFDTPNPHIPWAELPIAVPTTARPWPDGRRLAGVSSFGFSGTNAHVILEAVAPAPAEGAMDGAQVLTLSARTEPALRALAERWAAELRRPDVALPERCATANAGRAALEHRLAVTMVTAEQGGERLDAFARTGVAPGVITRRAVKGRTPEVAFLFTGQGAQYAGMGRVLYEGHPIFRAAIDRCDAALRGLWEPRLVDVLNGAAAGASLDDTAYTQVALFAIEWALAETWRSWGVTPSIVLGHSVGEYVAACVAGALEVEEAIQIVEARGRLMGALPAGGVMVAVSAPEARVREVLAGAGPGVAEIAAINGPESVVIAGEADAVSAVVKALGVRGIASQPLKVSHAFHTALMAPMQEAFAAAVAAVSTRTPRIPMVSTVTGQTVTAGAELGAAYWVHQIREPVRFATALERARRTVGDALWVEIGPHPVLTGLAQPWMTGGEWVPTLRRGHDDWATLLAALGTVWARGMRIDWRAGGAGRGRRTVTGLPTYPFQRERHWLDETPGRPAALAPSPHGHPLLGTRVRSATAPPHFEALLAADTPAFLADHRVHGHALLPSPAQMEMAAAAAAQVLGDEVPVLADFAIEHPLVLPEAPRPIQTVVTPEGPGTVSVAIMSLEDEASDRWQVHVRVTARRRTTAPSEGDGDELAEVQRRCRDAVDGADFYAMAAGRGLDFGPAFRGVERLWRGPREALAEICIPTSVRGEQGRYRIHPAVLDACLQTLGGALDAEDGETYLLVGADEISLPAANGASVPAWSHARLRATDARTGALTGDVRVLDASGVTLATVAGIHLRRARPESLARGRASRAADWVHHVAWRLAPRTGAELNGPTELAAAVEPHAIRLGAAEGLSMYDALLPALEALSARYVVHAFRELGWGATPGTRVETESLAATLGVEAKRHRLLSRLLGILAEEGVLQRDGTGWRVVAPLPEADVEAAERALLALFPAGAPEATVTLACGRALAAVLRGQTDPLQILFGSETRANTERLYSDTPAARTFNALVADAVAGAIGTAPRARRVRILEIGAGTGGTTGAILSALPPEATEYVLTDVSPAFTTRAAERLGASNRSFRPLDIERDPAAQGFAGERFDIVVAANVIHATRDLRRTLGHVRDLLAPGGLLLLLEGTARYRWVDLTFGLTDGWWHFTDLDLRPEHALLDGERWIDLLRACGLQDPTRLPARPSGRALAGQTVLIARAPAAEPAAITSGRDWLVLADQGGIGRRLVSSLETRGQRVTVIEPGDAARIAEAVRSGAGWHAVVDLRALDAGSATSAEVARTLHAQALDLIKVLVGASGVPRLWLVTRGAQPAGDGQESLAVAQAPLWGLGRVAALEQPELWGGLVDLDSAGTPAEAAERLAEQLADPDEEDQVAFRAGRRLVPRLVRDAAPSDPPRTVHGDGTYLITGGLGGLGLKIARWLVEQGARHLVLTGRRGLPAREAWAALSANDRRSIQVAEIGEIEQLGARVDVVAADVADRSAMTALFASFGSTRPALRGIVHAAADVRGEPLAEATAEVRDAVLAPKVTGSWLLHELSRDLPLDFFVLFSSTTALLGSALLGHYAAANQFLDALAHHRRREGLPALSVNWGTWDEMRVATDADRRAFAQGGLLPMRSDDALALLGRLAAGPAAQATVAAVDWDALIALYEVKRPRPLLAELRARPDAVAAAGRPRAVALRTQLQAAPAEARRDQVLEHVRSEVASVLGLDPSRVDVEQGLFDMGMDSLMAVDLKTRLETSVGQRLASTLTFNHPTVSALTAYLADQVLGLAPEPSETKTAPPPAAPETSQAHDDLTEDELAMLLAEKLGRIR